MLDVAKAGSVQKIKSVPKDVKKSFTFFTQPQSLRSNMAVAVKIFRVIAI